MKLLKLALVGIAFLGTASVQAKEDKIVCPDPPQIAHKAKSGTMWTMTGSSKSMDLGEEYTFVGELAILTGVDPVVDYKKQTQLSTYSSENKILLNCSYTLFNESYKNHEPPIRYFTLTTIADYTKCRIAQNLVFHCTK